MPRTPLQALAFGLGFWLALALSPLGARGARAEAGEAAAFEARLHAAVNAERAAHHLTALERSPALDAAARAHSEDMASRGFFSHVNPDGDSPVDRLHEAGVAGFTLAAENVGLTDEADPATAILRAWLDSPVHRRNLHAPPWNRTGIGIARGADGRWYTTQLYVTVPRP